VQLNFGPLQSCCTRHGARAELALFDRLCNPVVDVCGIEWSIKKEDSMACCIYDVSLSQHSGCTKLVISVISSTDDGRHPDGQLLFATLANSVPCDGQHVSNIDTTAIKYVVPQSYLQPSPKGMPSSFL
jgi:hypothetical protein